jgi:hypothetical protein
MSVPIVLQVVSIDQERHSPVVWAAWSWTCWRSLMKALSLLPLELANRRCNVDLVTGERS